VEAIVPDKCEGERLDKALAVLGCYKSRREAREAILQGAVYLDGRRVRVASRPVNAGARLRAEPVQPASLTLAPVTVLWESSGLLALDKPGGVPFAPTREAVEGTLLYALARERNLQMRSLHPIHRLDTPTSGAVLVATDKAEAARLSAALRRGRVQKQYLAWVHGAPEPERGEWTWPLAESPGNVMRVDPSGKEARTRYAVLRAAGGRSLLLLEPMTGRTHQLRVHCATAGYPIVGDRKYGKGAEGQARALLHAWKISFPACDGTIVEVTAPPPQDMEEQGKGRGR
jgi:RluA family pseudouridine synthase